MLLRFQTPNDRTAFLARLGREAPDLYEQTKPSYAQPTVLIVRNISEQDEKRILIIAGSLVADYADVQFAV